MIAKTGFAPILVCKTVDLFRQHGENDESFAVECIGLAMGKRWAPPLSVSFKTDVAEAIRDALRCATKGMAFKTHRDSLLLRIRHPDLEGAKRGASAMPDIPPQNPQDRTPGGP